MFRIKTRKKKITSLTDYFCQPGTEEVIDYKDVKVLYKFINRQGRIVSRLQSRLLRKHHAQVVTAIKRARQMALLPYEIVLQQIIDRPRKGNKFLSKDRSDEILNNESKGV